MKKISLLKSLKTGLQVCLLLAIVGLSFGPAGVIPAKAAPPSNDNWANALEVTSIPFTDTQVTTDASTESGEVGPGELSPPITCDGKFLRLGTRTIWYKYTPTVSGFISMDTVDTNYDDTYIAIWTGNPLNNTRALIACDDDNEVGFTSQMTVNLTAGVTYYIQIAKYNGVVGGSVDNSPCGGAGGECVSVFHVKNQTFTDVPPTHPYATAIDALYAAGLTAGCSATPLQFCPSASMSRAQSAVFMLRGNFGSSYVPVTPSHFFKDNWKNSPWGEGWAESMYLENLTAGCSSSPLKFCPDDILTKAQLAVFSLRLKYGILYEPPPAQGTVFADMTDLSFWGTAWSEQAYADGLIPDCGTSAGGNPNFCPNALVNRGLGAFAVAKAKNLIP